MVRIGIVHRNRWTGENVAVVTAIKPRESWVRWRCAGLTIRDCRKRTHGVWEAGRSPGHLGRRGVTGVELVNPDVSSVPEHYIKRPVPAYGNPGKIGSCLEGKHRRPIYAAVRRAGDKSAVRAASALAVSDSD